MRKFLDDNYYLNYKKAVKLAMIWFIVVFAIFCIITSFNIGGFTDALNTMVTDFFSGLLDDIAPTGEISFVNLLINNIIACLVMFLVGIVPFICLPLVYAIVLNSAIIGILIGAVNMQSGFYAGLMMFILGILPHGIFELPAFFFSAGAGVELTRAVNRKILKKETDVSVKDAFINGLKAFVFIVLPLLLIAALIESFVTVKILTTFGGGAF